MDIYNLNIEHGRWREVIRRACVIITVTVCIMEILQFILFNSFNLIETSLPDHLVRYLICPTVFNIIVTLIGGRLIFYTKLSDSFRNVIAISMLFLICICIQFIHFMFIPVLCISCIVIFVSILFSNVQLTRIVYLISNLILLIISHFIFKRNPDRIIEVLLEIILIAILYLASYMGAKTIGLYEEERTLMIYFGYKNQDEMTEKIKQDSFTGLYNRKEFFDILEQWVSKRKLSNTPLYLAIIDLDDFKRVNDTYGHARGDEVLIQLASMLKSSAGTMAYPARYGGEEFGMIIPSITFDKAVEFVEKLRTDFSAHKFSFMEGKKVTFSCGLVEYSGEGWSSAEFFDKADECLYKAKYEGKNRTVSMKNGKMQTHNEASI